jgi:5-methyltetrahydrofolate--homocysteine methyltransferase
MDDQLFSNISMCIFSGDQGEMEKNTRAALQAGYKPMTIIEKGLIPGMEKLGDEFGKGEAFLPELLIGAEAMKSSLALLKPLMKLEEVKSKGTVVIGTVLGDVHDIGKNIVAWMLEGVGFNIVDLGVDVPPERFIEAVKMNTPHILALSALLTTSCHQMDKVIGQLAEHGLRDNVKVIIGGASVNQTYADKIGADGYAPDAASAIVKIRELLGVQA